MAPRPVPSLSRIPVVPRLSPRLSRRRAVAAAPHARRPPAPRRRTPASPRRYRRGDAHPRIGVPDPRTPGPPDPRTGSYVAVLANGKKLPWSTQVPAVQGLAHWARLDLAVLRLNANGRYTLSYRYAQEVVDTKEKPQMPPPRDQISVGRYSNRGRTLTFVPARRPARPSAASPRRSWAPTSTSTRPCSRRAPLPRPSALPARSLTLVSLAVSASPAPSVAPSPYAIAPRLALVAGVVLAALPHLIAGTDSGDVTWLVVGVVAALIIVALTRFAAGGQSLRAAVVGDALALGALALAVHSAAIAALFVVAIVVHARRGEPLVAVAASLLAYIGAVLVRLAAGALPAGAGMDALGAVVLLGVAGVAVLAATPRRHFRGDRSAHGAASSVGGVSSRSIVRPTKRRRSRRRSPDPSPTSRRPAAPSRRRSRSSSPSSTTSGTSRSTARARCATRARRPSGCTSARRRWSRRSGS